MTVQVVTPKGPPDPYVKCGEVCPQYPDAVCEKHQSHYGAHFASWSVPGGPPDVRAGYRWEVV